MKNENVTPANVVNAANENVVTLTPEQEKAKNVLRARLPKLAAAGLNFEKRTGNFFTASLEKEIAKDADGNDKVGKDGNPVYVKGEDGKPVEKVRRLVVELTDETGNLLPKYAECIEEINAKRAAALVLDGEKRREKLEAERAAAEKALAESNAALATFDADLANAHEIVAAVELPERAARVAVTAQLAAVADENAKLRAKLIAMGINPDELTA